MSARKSDSELPVGAWIAASGGLALVITVALAAVDPILALVVATLGIFVLGPILVFAWTVTFWLTHASIGTGDASSATGGMNALEALREHYAHDEIDERELERRLEHLLSDDADSDADARGSRADRTDYRIRTTK